MIISGMMRKKCADMFSTTHLLYHQENLVGYFSLVTDTIINKSLRKKVSATPMEISFPQ